MRRELAWLGIALAGVLAAVLPLALGTHTPLQHDTVLSDLHHLWLPLRAYQGEMLSTGSVPLWNPRVLGGISLAQQVDVGLWYPPNMVLFAMLEPVRASSLSLVLALLMGGAGAYVLARSLGIGPRGAAFAALSFGLCGFQVAHLKHPNMVQAAAWLPWAWALLERGRRGEPLAWPALALALWLQMLTGHPQVSWMTAILLGLLSVAHGARARSWRPVLGVTAATGVALLLGGAALLPAWLLSLQSARAGGADLLFASAFHPHPVDLLTWISPALRGTPYNCTWSPPDASTLAWEDYSYQGLLTVLGAGWAAVVLLRERRVWLPLLVLAGALVFALSPWTPLYELIWWAVPGARLFRFPGRALLLAQLALALIAASGVEDILARQATHRGSRAVALVAAAILVLTTMDLAVSHRLEMNLDRAAPWSAAPYDLVGLEAPPHAPVRVYPIDSLDEWKNAWLQGCEDGSGPASLRAMAGRPLGSAPSQHGVETQDGYLVLFPWRLEATWSTVGSDRLPFYAQRPSSTGDLQLPRLRKQGVTHLVSPHPLAGLAEVEVGVYAVPGPAPRAYVTEAWIAVDDLQSALEQVDDADPRPAVEGAPSPAHPGTTAWSPVALLSHTPNRVLVDVAGHHGLLVLTETWDPGWSARIDSAPAETLVVNGTQRGVLVPEGAQRVEWSFWPEGLTAGLASTALGLLALVWWVVVGLRRRR